MGNQTPEQEAKLKADVKAEFDRIDTDKSGMIEKQEFRNLLETIAKKHGDGTVKESDFESTFNQFDKDKSGKLSFDEIFKNWGAFGLLVGLAGK